MDGVVVEPALLRHAQHTEARYESAKEVRDIRNASDNIELQIESDGLPDTVDLTWEPLQHVTGRFTCNAAGLLAHPEQAGSEEACPSFVLHEMNWY